MKSPSPYLQPSVGAASCSVSALRWCSQSVLMGLTALVERANPFAIGVVSDALTSDLYLAVFAGLFPAFAFKGSR